MKNAIITLFLIALAASACRKNNGHNGHNNHNDTTHFISASFHLYDSAHRVIQDNGADTTLHYPINRQILISEDTAAGRLVYLGDTFVCYNKSSIRLYSSKNAHPPFIDITDTSVIVKLYMSWVGFRTWEYLSGTKN